MMARSNGSGGSQALRQSVLPGVAASGGETPTASAPSPLPSFLTLPEVAAILRISPKTLRNSTCLGGGAYQDLPRIKIGTMWLIPKEAFVQWLTGRQGMVGASRPGDWRARRGAHVRS